MKFTKYLLILLTVLCSSCASLDISSLFESPLREHVYQRESRFADDEILIINMSGFIYSGKSRSLFSAGTTPDGIKKMLVKAQANRDLKAVILRINSPGGEVTATDMIHHELLLFKKRTGIPVYAIILSMGASGGYYLATAADEIAIGATATAARKRFIFLFKYLHLYLDFYIKKRPPLCEGLDPSRTRDI